VLTRVGGLFQTSYLPEVSRVAICEFIPSECLVRYYLLHSCNCNPSKHCFVKDQFHSDICQPFWCDCVLVITRGFLHVVMSAQAFRLVLDDRVVLYVLILRNTWIGAVGLSAT
jgi:hypothetical protein